MIYRRCSLTICTLVFCLLHFSISFAEDSLSQEVSNQWGVKLTLINATPNSNNLDYALFVFGPQPEHQRWKYLTINPSASPAFELELDYYLKKRAILLYSRWLHLSNTSSDRKQANPNLPIKDVEFVAPAFDVGPASFGIKHVEGKVDFNLDDIVFNIAYYHHILNHFHAKFFGGLTFVRLKELLEVNFNDYAGVGPTPLTKAMPADPRWSFTIKNTSTYQGLGPNIGFNLAYLSQYGIGVLGEINGSLTAGTIKLDNAFKGTSSRLLSQGISVNEQSLAKDNSLQVVPGGYAKLGFIYEKINNNNTFFLELGYKIAGYYEAILQAEPDSLVQVGKTELPDFATGTMAIQSTKTVNASFYWHGPYLSLGVLVS